MNGRRNDLEIMNGCHELLRGSEPGSISSLRCHKSRRRHPVRDGVAKRCFADNVDTRLPRLAEPKLAATSPPLPFGLRRGSLRFAPRAKAGGARRDRTDDLMLAKHALSQLSYGPVPEDECKLASTAIKVVGLGRLELPTSRLSSARSNQLSYKPVTRRLQALSCRPRSSKHKSHAVARLSPARRSGAASGACSSAKKEKRGRRCPANAA